MLTLLLTIWRPFYLGQTVEVLPENLKGRVVDHNLMFTVLREEDGSTLEIPNNFFFQKMFRVTGTADAALFEHPKGPDQKERRERATLS